MRLVARLFAAGALFAAVQPANAALIITKVELDAPGGRTGNVVPSPNGAAATAAVSIGRLQLTGKDSVTNQAVSTESFCVDLMHWLSAATFNPTTPAFSAVKLSRLNAIMANAAPGIATRDQSAATQLAIWEIVTEADGAAYNLGAGSFRVSGGDSAAAAVLAKTYLDKVTTNAWTASSTLALNFITAPGNQTQMYASAVRLPPGAGAVPEPATWATMVMGFGLAGAALRRRGRRGATAAA